MHKKQKPIPAVIDTSEFIHNPSTSSQHLVDKVAKIGSKYINLISSTNPLIQLRREVKFKIYIAEGYKHWYKKLQEFDISINTDLEHIFCEMMDAHIFHNYCLAYLVAQGEEFTHTVVTKEDERLFMLKQLGKNNISMNAFLKEFGHYAHNPYELEDKRYFELKPQNILTLAKLAQHIPDPQGIPLDKAIIDSSISKVDLFTAIRELGKYTTIKIVAKMKKRDHNSS